MVDNSDQTGGNKADNAPLLTEYEQVNSFIRAAYEGSFRFTNLILLLQGGLATGLALFYDKQQILGSDVSIGFMIVEKPAVIGVCIVGFLSAILAYRTAQRYLTYVSSFASRGIEIEKQIGLRNLTELQPVWQSGKTKKGSIPFAAILSLVIAALWIFVIFMHFSIK